MRGEVFGRATDRGEVEGPVGVAEHHAPVVLEPARERQHGSAGTQEAVYEHDWRQIGPRPGHVGADLVAPYEVTAVLDVMCDDLDRLTNTVL